MDRWGGLLACVAACGRIGFEPPAGGIDGMPATSDGGSTETFDGGVQTIACADMNLGSALGANVASGTTDGAGNQTSACSGDGPDLTFGWFAPATASYRIDLCNSDMSWDSVLTIRDGTCGGAQLACDDDSCGGPAMLQGRVTVNLTAGQGIVIVVDSLYPTVGGNYQLAITQL